MALPGLALPGLLSAHTPTPGVAGPDQRPASPRITDLTPRSEWRFEVAFNQQYHVKLLNGMAEIFGVEMAPGQTQTFSGLKGAIFTWHGCQLHITGEAESEYAGRETDYAIEWINLHGELQRLREQRQGPRVLVVGPDGVGKTSLVRNLATRSVRMGSTPIVLNLDSRQGLLGPPSSITAVAVDSQTDVQTGYGIAPMTGPTTSPVRTPLIYHYPYASASENPSMYKALLTRMALSVDSKIQEDAIVKSSGIIIDTPGSLNDPKTNYDIVSHIISEFSIDVLLTMGSERLSNDLTRKFASANDSITVVNIAKSAGVVELDSAFTKQLRTQQLRQYFYGSSLDRLDPHSHTLSFADIDVYRAKSATDADDVKPSGLDATDDDDYDIPYANGDVNKSASSSAVFEKITPSAAMTGSLLAIKHCATSNDMVTIRDSAVKGFLWVAEVDEAKRRVRVLSPHPQLWGDRALVWSAGWPEAVGDLVTK